MGVAPVRRWRLATVLSRQLGVDGVWLGLGFVRAVKGQPAVKLLPGIMAATLRSLNFPKFMNWDAEIDDGRGAFAFGRPIRWMVCLFAAKVVPFEIRLGENGCVKAGKKTRGHRFLAPKGKRAGAFRVSSFRDLKQGLKKYFVVLDPEEREKRLEKEIQKLEKKAGAGRPSRLRGLSTRALAGLVEWPGAVLGTGRPPLARPRPCRSAPGRSSPAAAAIPRCFGILWKRFQV